MRIFGFIRKSAKEFEICFWRDGRVLLELPTYNLSFGIHHRIKGKRADNGQGLDAIDNENLASTLIQQDKFAEAVGYERRAVDIQKQREGEVSGNTAVALDGLAVAEDLNGSTADAERDFRAALVIGEKLHATQNIDMFQWRLPLADFLIGEKRCEQAVPLLNAVIDELKPRMPLRDPLPLYQAHLLLGQCQGGKEGAAMQAAARKALCAIPAVEIDIYPTARKFLIASPPAK